MQTWDSVTGTSTASGTQMFKIVFSKSIWAVKVGVDLSLFKSWPSGEEWGGVYFNIEI